jgi:hypothetical protein
MSSNTSNSNGAGEQGIQVRSEAGVTRVTLSRGNAPAEETPQQPQQPQQRVQASEGTLRVDARTGTLQPMPVSRANVSGAADPTGASGLLATARTKWGTPPRELQAETMVTLPGTQMQVELRVAERMGYVRRENGTYVEVAQTEQQQPEQPQPSPQQQRTEALNAQIAKDLSQIVGDLDQRTLDQIITEHAIMYGTSGQVEASVERIQSLTGWDAQRAAVYLAASEGAFKAQEGQLLDSFGIHESEHPDFVQWALAERPSEFKRAAVAHRRAGSLDVYEQLADQYMRSTPPAAEALNAAGIATKTDATTGELLLRLPSGQWMSVRAAAKQGLI